MEPNRKAAKEAITDKGQNDPELDQTLKEAHNFQLELLKENNFHARQMNQANLGFIGKILGDGKNTQMFIAMLAVGAGVVLFIGCLFCAYKSPENSDFWSKQGERALAFAAAALAYIFGAGSKSE